MYLETKGDLFAAFDERLPAIAHGCNTEGVMGAGVAKIVRQRYPEMYKYYRDECLAGRFKLEDFMPWSTNISAGHDDPHYVYNLATQEQRGADARYSAVGASLYGAMRHARLVGIGRIGVPQIGCGIGGLEWKQVRIMFEVISALVPEVDLEVFSL